MSEIKCVALDLDRTTLNKEGKLSAGNKEAIEKAIAKGIHVIIASGRAFDTLPKDVTEITGIEYAITSNGAVMYSVPDKKCLTKRLLQKKAVELVLALTENEPVTYEAFIDGIAYAPRAYVEDPERFGATPQAVAYVQSTRHLVEDIKLFIREHIDELESMDIIVKEESEKFRLWELIAQECEGVYVTSSVKQLLEISDEQGGKHAGVKYFAELLNIDPLQIAAFGDGDNDIDMLQYVGHGFAVENATSKCKKAARYLTKHHDEDGVAYGLREILKVID